MISIPFVLITVYVKKFEVHDPQRVGKIKVELLGRIKDCRAITYRQDIRAHEIEDYRRRTLPTGRIKDCRAIYNSLKVNQASMFMKCFFLQWGYVVITTPNGVLDHEEAVEIKPVKWNWSSPVSPRRRKSSEREERTRCRGRRSGKQRQRRESSESWSPSRRSGDGRRIASEWRWSWSPYRVGLLE
ncbi:hypothetical protein LXL04_033472 [Taraxacum kok-saghyz]